MTVWILTSEYNECDQYGEYFIEVFDAKPTHSMLKLRLGCTDDYINHILKVGGRSKDMEYMWYNLKEVEVKHIPKLEKVLE